MNKGWDSLSMWSGFLGTVRTPPDHLVQFGRAVRRARRERDMSQEALGRAAGLDGKHVSEIERANRDVRFTTLLQLAQGLGLPPSELLELYDAQCRRS
jgi:transcriptional regulator with XRE-family HTH domain